MKTLIVTLLLASGLWAESLLPMGAKLINGAVTIECNYVDISAWGGVFALVTPQFRCYVETTNADTESVSVTIESRDSAGVTHEKSQVSAMQNGATILVFPTKDTVLLSVSVAEMKVPLRFSQEAK